MLQMTGCQLPRDDFEGHYGCDESVSMMELPLVCIGNEQIFGL